MCGGRQALSYVYLLLGRARMVFVLVFNVPIPTGFVVFCFADGNTFFALLAEEVLLETHVLIRLCCSLLSSDESHPACIPS